MKPDSLARLQSAFLVFLISSVLYLSFSLIVPPSSAFQENFAIDASGNDGYAYGRNSDYSTARSTAFASSNTASYSVVGQRYYSLQNYYFVFRTYLKFNTSTIPSDASISSASLKIYCITPNYSATAFDVQIQGWTGDTPIDNGDYNQYSETIYGSLSTSYFVLNAWNVIPITNLNLIQREGNTKACLRSSRDTSSIAPSGNEYIHIYNCDQGSAYAPYLEINFTAPAPTYSSVGHNTSLAGANCEFYVNWASSSGLGGYVFGWNKTGIPTNDTWTDPWAGSPKTGWSNVTKTLSIEGGNAIEWCVWANDTHNQWNTTELMIFVVSSYPVYFNVTSSDAIAGKTCTFNATWEPKDGSLSHYILETNNTGYLVNYTYPFGGSPFSNVTLVLNSTRYMAVQWRIFANNTDNRWNCTTTQLMTLFPPPPPMQRGVLGYTDMSGENALYCKGAEEAIYIAWLNSSAVKFQVSAYDVGSQAWTPVFDIANAPSPEGHWQPSVGLFPNGSLVVFYGHLTAIKYRYTRQSVRAQANLTSLLTDWSPEYFIPETENKHCSFPYPASFDDVLVLYYRYDDFYHWRVINYTDTWQPGRMLMSSSKEIYMWFMKANESMIMGFGNIQDNGYKHVLLFYSNDKGITYNHVNGTSLTLPFDYTAALAVQTDNNRRANTPCLDKDGRVSIGYMPTEFLTDRWFTTIVYYNTSIGNPGGSFLQANATDQNDQVIEASLNLLYDTYYEQPSAWCSPLNKFNVSLKQEYNIGNPTKYIRMPNNFSKFLKVYENSTLSARVEGRQIQNMPRAFEVFGRIEQGYALGFQKKGSINYTDWTVDRIIGCKYVANATLKVNSIVIRIWWAGSINSLYGKAALYDSSLHLISGGTETNIVGGYDKEWDYWTVKMPLSDYIQIEAGQTYWICIRLNGGAFLSYDLGSTNQSFVVFTRYLAPWNQTLPITSFDDRQYSFFAVSIDLECYGLKLRVHNLNTDLRYVTIQEGINAPETLNGHTIFVEGGVFLESVTVSKSLTILADSIMNVIVDGMTIVGFNVIANDCRIENFIIMDGDKGVYVYQTNNVTVRSNFITGNRDGICLYGASDCMLSENNITSTSQYGINMTCQISNVTVKNNIINGNSDGIYVSEASNCTLSENKVMSNSQHGINMVYQINNIAVKNNVVTGNSDGIYLYEASNCTLTGNNVTSNSHYGLNLNCSSACTLRSNNMSNNRYNFGLVGNELLHYMHDIDQSNMVGAKRVYYLTNMLGGSVDGLLFQDVGFLGIVNSTRVHVKNVPLSDNIQGILFVNTNDSSVMKSNITSNLYGFHLWSSHNNTVFYNNFINNAQQAYPTYSVNVWDNGYPSGGNYWSDYAGTDLQSGPYQNETNSDGIGDTPYVVDASNLDNYPLMTLYPCIHAVATINVTPFEAIVKRGNITQGNVSIINQGHFSEIFNVTVYANGTAVDTQVDIAVASGGSAVVTYTWNTTGFELGDYNMSAYAGPVIGEVYVVDNVYMDGWIHVGYHDIAVLNITTSRVLIGRGFNVTISVTLENQGDYNETFDLFVYSNSTVVGVFNVELLVGNSTIISFTWGTSGFAYGNYTVNADAVPVPSETELEDNTLSIGMIKVSIPGDINGDFKVDPYDFALFSRAYGTTPGMPKWNMYADFNCNDRVGPEDFAIMSKYYGQHYP
jgi:parallel beta-helix repeat protein